MDLADLTGAENRLAPHYSAFRVADRLLLTGHSHQVGRLCRLFDELDLDPAVVARDRSVPLDRLGGFLALRSSHAATIQRELAVRGVMTDHRWGIVRFGPAPYLSDRQLDDAVAQLGDVARDLDRGAAPVSWSAP